MVKVRLTKDSTRREPPRPERETEPKPKPKADQGSHPTPRGMTERQWFISLLVAAGLLLLLTFRGCALPSGVGPKAKPSAPPTQTAPPSGQPGAGQEYTVQGGDTLSAIASRFGVTVDALAQANNINLNQRVILRVGQKLTIPAKTQ